MLFKRRDKFDRLNIKIGILFSKIPLTPNQWTFLSFLPAILSAYFIAIENFLAAALMLLLAGFTDVVDGAVAKATKRVTKLGAYMDTIVDRYVEAIIMFGLLFASLPDVYFPSYVWIFLYLFGSMLTTYAKAAAKEKGLGEIKGGVMERAERLLLLFAGLVLALYGKIFLAYVIVTVAVLANISALQRILYTARSSNK